MDLIRLGLAGMVKIGDVFPSKAQFCGNFSVLNVGGCHTDKPAELLTEEGDQMPGVPYKVDLAYPKLNLTTIPKRNPLDRPQYAVCHHQIFHSQCLIFRSCSVSLT
jgi:hypothetical protein